MGRVVNGIIYLGLITTTACGGDEAAPPDAETVDAAVVDAAAVDAEVADAGAPWDGGESTGVPTSCADHLARGQTSDGIYEIDIDGAGPAAPIAVFCDMSTDGGGWTMVYKKSAGTPLHGYALWTLGAVNDTNPSLLNREQAQLDYVSSAVQMWSTFAPSEARIEVIDDGDVVREVIFDTTDSNSVSWFAPERVTASAWEDLPTAPGWQGSGYGRYFSIEGGADRSWYISKTWGQCDDEIWLAITHSDWCDWEDGDPNAQILYSADNTVGRTKDSSKVRRADAFAVFVR